MPDERKRVISISQLDMMSKCGEQYRQRYVLGRKAPPGIAILMGKALDKTVDANLGRKMDGNGLMPVKEVQDLARDQFEIAWGAQEVALTPEELALGLKAVKRLCADRTIRIARTHAVELAPAIEPTHVQRRCVVELPGYPVDLIGYIDIQEGMRAIRDTKNSTKAPSDDEAAKSDQLTMYAMMSRVIDGAIPEQLCLDYVIDTQKIGKAEPKKGPTTRSHVVTSTRTDEDFRPILNRLETALMALEKGVFVPARETDWWCDSRWCGYHRTCKYVKRPRQFAA